MHSGPSYHTSHLGDIKNTIYIVVFIRLMKAFYPDLKPCNKDLNMKLDLGSLRLKSIYLNDE